MSEAISKNTLGRLVKDIERLRENAPADEADAAVEKFLEIQAIVKNLELDDLKAQIAAMVADTPDGIRVREKKLRLLVMSATGAVLAHLNGLLETGEVDVEGLYDSLVSMTNIMSDGYGRQQLFSDKSTRQVPYNHMVTLWVPAVNNDEVANDLNKLAIMSNRWVDGDGSEPDKIGPRLIPNSEEEVNFRHFSYKIPSLADFVTEEPAEEGDTDEEENSPE